MINWATICSSLKEGGLGIKTLKVFNKALMGKWLWRFLTEKEALWRMVVMGKYGAGEHVWFPNDIISSFGVSVWKKFRKGWDSFERNIAFEIGNGSSIRFWKDRWCDVGELRRAFPMLFNFAGNKDDMVSLVLQVKDGISTWSPCF